jgi:hypothetical protein
MPRIKTELTAQDLNRKVLVRLSRSDTIDLNSELPTIPSTAIIKGEARGQKGNWTGVYAYSERSIALYAESPVFAAWFDGDVQISGDFTHEGGVAKLETAHIVNVIAANMTVTGDIAMPNADCAEDFEVSDASSTEPGTVMILANEDALSASEHAYDKRVAGVISGAGTYKPGIVLDRQPASLSRLPIALMGKVFCKVDAQYGAIEVGDLLTTSPTRGHAMKTSDPAKAFGAVIGKALRPLSQGCALIPILIALQ